MSLGRPNDQRPVLFLDFDDVLCLNTTYGGYDALLALSQVENGKAALESFENLWRDLFTDWSKTHLMALHREFNPLYVLSTSWTHFMDKGAMVTILRQTGLADVADNLHPAWETVKGMGKSDRAQEIRDWIALQPEHRNHWVVLDDPYSGAGLANWPVKQEQPFIVLCTTDAGFLGEYDQLRRALLLRTGGTV